MSTLITGSLAFDTIMVFHDRFKNHILPEKMHILNVCFLVNQMRKEFGGCAGNIAYNLKLLGGDPIIMATVGEDFAPYRKQIHKLGLSDKHITEIADSYTAQAFLTTDSDNNQIIAFHPGAMNEAHQNKVSDAENIISLGIVAPDGREAMINHAQQFAALGIPFFFDPGQGLPMFDKNDLKQFINQAHYICVNDYESEMLLDKTGLSLDEIANQVESVIVTRGGKGSEIYTGGEKITIAPIKVNQIVDPTGCGDAFRSGLLYGIKKKWNWQQIGQLASVMGGLKIEVAGTQNHRPSKQQIVDRYYDNYAEKIAL